MNIFDGIENEKLDVLLNCLQSVKKSYFKDEMIFDKDQKLTSVGYVLSGKVHLVKDDYNGNKIIVSEVKHGETFGEAVVCADKNSLVSAFAKENSEILFLDFKRILSICSNSCQFHKQLIANIIKIIAEKNLALQNRIELLSKKTLRERIWAYLNSAKTETENEIFEIPFSREEMSDFLAADRSALSRELAKMKSEKIIDYHKNSFKIFK